MRHVLVFSACVGALALGVMPVPAIAAERSARQDQTILAESPEALVAGIYRAYVGRNAKGIDLTIAGAPDRYFTPATAALIVADQREAQGEIGRLDGDIFMDAQDWSLTQPPGLSTILTAADKATVTATFKNKGQIRYFLIKGAQGWRIDDIILPSSTDSLVRILKQPL